MRDIFTFSEMGRKIDPNLFSGAALVFGHFNVIHPGHIRYFQTAKDHGRTLIVAIEGDGQLSGLERQKVFSEKDRAQAIASLELIDAVIIL
ncbi:MAG TPA: ADP-heptose synthase, partial [Dehalococcoidia bacterium]|nr:ADP-heptose synthase [Dehalococcoidia bacterium]